MSEKIVYAEWSWRPVRAGLRLTSAALRPTRGRPLRVGELNLLATAEAYLRGQWVGGGGVELPVARIPEGRGGVPVIRTTGSAVVVRARRAAAFARAYGEWAVRLSGGPEAVAAAADDVPLWLARRTDGPVVVTVDRALVRADVWAPGVPAARLRGDAGLTVAEVRVPRPPLTVTVGEEEAVLETDDSWEEGRSVTLRTAAGSWRMERVDERSSRVLRDGRQVAVVTRPEPWLARHALLHPLAGVSLTSDDPLDAVLAHFLGVVCGLGDATGVVRFGLREVRRGGGRSSASSGNVPAEARWDAPWSTGLGSDSSDSTGSGGGAGGDGWDSGGDGGGGDGGGGGGGGD